MRQARPLRYRHAANLIVTRSTPQVRPPEPLSFAILGRNDAVLVRVAVVAERYRPDETGTALIKLRQFGEMLAQLVAIRAGVFTSRDEPKAERLRRLKGEAGIRGRSSTFSIISGVSETTRSTSTAVTMRRPSTCSRLPDHSASSSTRPLATAGSRRARSSRLSHRPIQRPRFSPRSTGFALPVMPICPRSMRLRPLHGNRRIAYRQRPHRPRVVHRHNLCRRRGGRRKRLKCLAFGPWPADGVRACMARSSTPLARSLPDLIATSLDAPMDGGCRAIRPLATRCPTRPPTSEHRLEWC